MVNQANVFIILFNHQRLLSTKITKNIPFTMSKY
jgi:hypothetical protein